MGFSAIYGPETGWRAGPARAMSNPCPVNLPNIGLAVESRVGEADDLRRERSDAGGPGGGWPGGVGDWCTRAAAWQPLPLPGTRGAYLLDSKNVSRVVIVPSKSKSARFTFPARVN